MPSSASDEEEQDVLADFENEQQQQEQHREDDDVEIVEMQQQPLRVARPPGGQTSITQFFFKGTTNVEERSVRGQRFARCSGLGRPRAGRCLGIFLCTFPATR